MAYYSSSTPLQRPPNGLYTENSSFYGVHIPSNIKRRKRSHQNWAKFATKCVLASPLIVLVLWSVAVMAHSSSSPQQQNIASSSSTARTSTKASLVVEPSHQEGNNKSGTSSSSSSSLPVYVPLGQPQQSGGSSSTIVVRPRPHPRGGNVMTMTASQNAMMTTTNESDGNAMQINGGMMNTQNEMAVLANGSNAQNGNPNGVMLMNTQDGNAMTTTTTTQYDSAMTQQQGVMTATTTNLGDNVLAAAEIAENVLGNNAVAMSTLQKSHPKKAAAQVNNVYPAAARKTTRILYYDPAVGTETVYDEDGTPILLSSLQTDTTEIYLEKPPASTLAKLEYEWGESQAQDQMIIISTVATMALLVGALSARRMRSRQFLSSCIENESLADEVAYDTAYTTNGYDTFGVGGGPWKGDLEKFDV